MATSNKQGASPAKDMPISRMCLARYPFLCRVIFAVPVHEFRQSVLNWSGRPESRSLIQVVHLRVCGDDIPRLHRAKNLASLDAHGLLDDLDKLEHIDRLVVPQVIDFLARIAPQNSPTLFKSPVFCG